jgi:hypothetical protein
MAGRFLETYSTPGVLAAQEKYYGRARKMAKDAGRDPLGADEAEFIAQRDSFYLASVTSDGWPYVQHRGGPRGFLRVVDPNTLGFADFGGNRQLISTGNLATSDRVALFLMDYPNRSRLKIAGHARVLDARENRDLADDLAPSVELRPRVERVMLIDVVGFDWNCSQFITERFTADEIRGAVEPLHEKIAALEAEVKRLRQG